jgi:HNH endonuclease
MPRPKLSKQLKQLVRERAHFCCEYCLSQEAYSPDPFSNEHIIALSAGGHSTANNLAFSCQGCNNFKYTFRFALDLVTLQEVPLYHPRQDRWADHFSWNDDASELIGLTATGRATIETLQLNREQVVNLRRVLSVVGKHPPTHLFAST